MFLKTIFSIKIRVDIKHLVEIEDLQPKLVKQVEFVEKQGFLYDVKELFEPLTKSIKDFSEDVTTTLIDSCKKKNKALTTLNSKRLEIMNDKVRIASNFLSLLSKITNPENNSHFK